MDKQKNFAVTTSVARTWGSFTVTWTPSATAAELTVTVTAGGDLLDSQVFMPNSATQQMSGTNGTFTFSGTIIAAFDSSGMTGQLIGSKLSFQGPNGNQSFSGTIGNW